MHLALSWEDPHLREHPVVSAQRAEILIWLPTWPSPEHRSGVGSAPRPFPCQMQRFPRAKGEEGLSTSSSGISPSSPSASDPLIHEKKMPVGRMRTEELALARSSASRWPREVVGSEGFNLCFHSWIRYRPFFSPPFYSCSLPTSNLLQSRAGAWSTTRHWLPRGQQAPTSGPTTRTAPHLC